MKTRSILLAIALSLTSISLAQSQTYPNKPIRFIVGQTAGGGSDMLARTLGQKLNDAWGQPVVVENRPGAAGAIGTELVAKAAPDGYTLLFSSSGPIVINQSLYSKLSYDPIKDLAPIAFVASAPLMLVIHPSIPAKSVKELISLAKARPNRFTYGSGGSGSPAHLAAELFGMVAGVKMVHVPFKGSGPSVVALVAGQVDLTFATALITLPQVKANRLRALAVTTPKRSQVVPELPTVAEAGVPEFEAQQWYGLFGPAALPKEISAKLGAEATRVMNLADVRARLSGEGAEPGNLTLDQFVSFIRADAARWAKVIKEFGTKLD